MRLLYLPSKENGSSILETAVREFLVGFPFLSTILAVLPSSGLYLEEIEGLFEEVQVPSGLTQAVRSDQAPDDLRLLAFVIFLPELDLSFPLISIVLVSFDLRRATS